jgi:hypothetical protein
MPEPIRKATQLLVYPDEKLKLKEEMSKSPGDGKFVICSPQNERKLICVDPRYRKDACSNPLTA